MGVYMSYLLMLFALEAIKRGQLSFRTRQIAAYVGFALIAPVDGAGVQKRYQPLMGRHCRCSSMSDDIVEFVNA